MNPFGHIDIRVRDLEEACAFYGKFLPELGFPVRDTITDTETWETFAMEGYPTAPFVSMVEDKNHIPNANCLAFRVSSNSIVDQLAERVIQAGAKEVEGPEPLAPGFEEHYYAVFFKDPSGNRLEIYHWR